MGMALRTFEGATFSLIDFQILDEYVDILFTPRKSNELVKSSFKMVCFCSDIESPPLLNLNLNLNSYIGSTF